MYLMIRILALFAVILTGSGIGFGNPPVDPGEDFVKVSICITDPGDAIYSCAGHAFFRMQCPSEGMDYCFSYESESVKEKVLTFLSGNLRMGMAVARTPDYLRQYVEKNRGVKEYPLNLPIKIKQNLWRVLDGKVGEGMELPYDYLERGCAHSLYCILREAAAPCKITFGIWPDRFSMTRREILSSELEAKPWTRIGINILTNGKANDNVPDEDKCITPRALMEMLESANIDGHPVLAKGQSLVLVAGDKDEGDYGLSPMAISIIILLLTVGLGVYGKSWMLYILLVFQTLLGSLNVYLIFFSSLCATEWSWLLIPFNPLPAVLWKWRKYWEIPYGALILFWVFAMAIVPHSLTDPALVMLALSVAVSYFFDRGCGDRILITKKK